MLYCALLEILTEVGCKQVVRYQTWLLDLIVIGHFVYHKLQVTADLRYSCSHFLHEFHAIYESLVFCFFVGHCKIEVNSPVCVVSPLVSKDYSYLIFVYIACSVNV